MSRDWFSAVSIRRASQLPLLLDSMHPEQYWKLPSYSTFYENFRRVVGVFPSLSRLGLGRRFSQAGYGDLPPKARDEERAFLSTPRDYRSLLDEFAE